MNEIAQTFSLAPQTFDQAMTFANMLADSDMVPKDFKSKPGNCLIAIQWGYEVGLQPLQSLQNIAVINGRPAMWGDAVIALVRASPLCEYIKETDDGNTATCAVKRKGQPEEVRTFSMADAKLAGLEGKAGPWTNYPKRMRQMRARAFALRDVFPDVLRGMAIAEEAMDTEKDMGMAVRVDERDEPQQQKPLAIEYYPAENFTKNLPAWTRLLQDRKKSLDDIITMAECRAPLSEEQQKTLKAIEIPEAPTASEPTPQAEAGEQQ